MARFILYDLDPTFWARVQAKAKAEGVQVKALILKLLTTWLGLFVVIVLSTACAYHNPTQPTPPADDLTAPTTLTLGTMPGTGARSNTTVVTAHVQNLHGTPLTNMIVIFSTTAGTVSPDAANTGADGSASTTLTAAGDARVSVTVGPMHNSTLIAAPNGAPGPTPPTPTPSAGVFLNVQGAALTGDPVSFSVSSQAMGVLWQWNFGDGATDQTTAFSTTHVYGRAGVFLASVSGAGTASASAPITISNKPVVAPPPAAALAVTVGCTPGTHGTTATACNVRATFGGTALPGGAITGVDWDWGDGTTADNHSATPVQTHTYTSAGTYTVLATVTANTSAGSQTATTSTSVIVP